MFNKKDADTSHVSEPKSEPVIETETIEEDRPTDPSLSARSVSYIGPGLTLTGEINAEGGTVILSVNAAEAIVNNVVNLNGVVDVTSVTEQDGREVVSMRRMYWRRSESGAFRIVAQDSG